MLFEDYTEDNICRAMGIAGFEPPTKDLDKDTDVLRLVFAPSFDPELCITFIRRPSECKAAITVLSRQLWREPLLCILPEHTETARVPGGSLDELFRSFLELATDNRRERGICIDGIRLSYAYHSLNVQHTFRQHSSSCDPVASTALHFAWAVVTDPSVKNGLAAAAKYLGIKEYSVIPEPEPPAISRLLILGTPDDRRDYFTLLNGKRKHEA